jgi:two-component system, NarL family, sensor histidine kinase DesK
MGHGTEEEAAMAFREAMTGCRDPGGRPSLTGTGVLGKWAPGTGSPLRWFFSAVWLVYLIQPVAGLFHHGHSPLWITGGVVLTLVFCAIYVVIMGTWHQQLRRAQAGLVVIIALTVLGCLVYGSGWTTLWIYVSAATGCIVTRRGPALLAVLGVGACFALFSRISHVPASTFLTVLLPVVLVGWAMIGFRMQILLLWELRRAREAVAKMAANEERLRLARDMHDLTGQSLSLVTLKSELAVRRLAALDPSAERDAALAEMTDIGRVSRQTLHDIREAVSGYRRPTLAVELITARTSLEAAGVHLDDDPALTLRSGTFDAEAEAALAWCLREAATNVIRHSGARNCRIRLTERAGELVLEVSDDGQGLTGTGPGAARGGAAPSPSPGSGLHGMSERLSAVGGRLAAGAGARFAGGPAGSGGRGGQGFGLIATVPATPVPASAPPAAPVPAGRDGTGASLPS